MRASHSLEEAAHAPPGPSARPDRGDRAQNSAMGVLIPRHRSSATARSSAGPWEGSSAGTSAAALLEPAPTQAAPAEAWRLELRTRLQPRAVARAARSCCSRRSLFADGVVVRRRVVAVRRPRSALRKDFVVRGAPLRGELKAAGIILFYYFAQRAPRAQPCFGNETAARSVFDCSFCSGASRVAKELYAEYL